MTATMRTVVTRRHGGPEVLGVEDLPIPTLHPGQVRIEVHAAGLNFSDTMTRSGRYPHAPAPPLVGGFEVAGVVTETADGIEYPAVGQRVIAVTMLGAFAEQVCVDHRDVLALPDTLSFPQGAAVPITYATAHAGLIRYGNLHPDERVLILAAGGGVGTAAVQLAAHLGAEVHAAASPAKHEAVRRLGAHTTLDYTRRDWRTGLPAYDLVMDAIGGESFASSYDLLRTGGRLVAFGAASAFGRTDNDSADTDDFRVIDGLRASNLMIDSKAVIGLDLAVLWEERGTLQPWLMPLQDLLNDKVIDPVVSHVLPFEAAAEAHDILSDRRNVGKVVLTP